MASGPQAKIERAKKHLSDLAEAVNEYLHSDPAPVAIEGEVEADGAVVGRFRLNEELPIEIPLILGDGIHNLRSALDILICDLVRHQGGEVEKRHAFPIYSCRKSFEQNLERRTEGLSDAAVDEIRRLQPYQDGDDRFWLLHKLDIADKHRLLLTVAAADSGGIDIGDMATAALRRLGVEGIEVPGVRIPPAEVDCYEDGDVVYRYDDPPEDFEKIKYGFDVALTHEGLVECEPVWSFLDELVEFTDEVVRKFDPFFI